MPPTLAHAYQGAVGGVSALLYLVAAMAAFVFLESRDASRTADARGPLRRRTKVAGAVLVVSLVGGITAPWWVPHDERPVTGAADQVVSGSDCYHDPIRSQPDPVAAARSCRHAPPG